MLTIRKFAELAGTTRRTLLFYDAQDLFKPVQVAANGYRYYSYDQLYQLKFILQLRKLGLAVTDIKTLIQSDQPQALTEQLQAIFANIQTEINSLTQLKQTLTERYQQPDFETVGQLHTPRVVERPTLTFWCSPLSVGCTDEAISELYRTFYDLIGPLKLLNKHESGFLTELPGADPEKYPTANFQILKAVSLTNQTTVPTIQRPAGRYVTATAMNDTASILLALTNLQQFIAHHHLHVGPHMWQLNLDEILTSKAGSEYLSIEYQIE